MPARNDASRSETSFMRSLVRMFERETDIFWDRGTIVIRDPSRLEKVLPQYYRTSKFSSFQRQLNNFGYHRAHDSFGGEVSGVRYHKVVGSPASSDVRDLLSLRPLMRRSKKRDVPKENDDLVDHRKNKRPALPDNEMFLAAHCLLALDNAQPSPRPQGPPLPFLVPSHPLPAPRAQHWI
ncbi:hypothetical protein CTAYLR_010426 [Chrysophaeum taylorii]|uniref:HSF-type DNA-binding domain-containing protein n=1 Tax=Chrysophaeum taylorii TaxID=2483200 RepID=A0AAD7UBC9_9STRA|nr:hypothetical protein CTAYLR_010426 [Chrysophaeum taylorii]